MRFPEGWEVQVTRPENAAHYADITHGAEKYVVGVPDQPFEVRVTVPAHKFQFTPIVRVSLEVDGRSPNVNGILTAKHPTYVFKGFVSTVKGENITNQFLFGKAETDPSAPACKPGTNKVGGLHVTLQHVQELPGHSQPSVPVFSQAAAGFQAVEGKKWFMQPSLSTQSGNITGGPVRFSNTVYGKVRDLADLNLKMETAAILILRKVLDPEIPAHQAIIDRSQEQEEGEGESQGAAGNPRGAKRVKTEQAQSNRAIKTETSQTPRSRNAAQKSGIIDLT